MPDEKKEPTLEELGVRLPEPPRPPETLEDLGALRAYLDEFALYMRFVHPPVRAFPVASPDPLHTQMFLELDKVCVITTRTGGGGREDETMWVTREGERYYCSEGLAKIERELCFPRPTSDGSMDASAGGNPWFLRTHQSYIVNLKRVRAFAYSEGALTLWFEGIEESFKDVVSDTHRARFDPYFIGIR